MTASNASRDRQVHISYSLICPLKIKGYSSIALDSKAPDTAFPYRMSTSSEKSGKPFEALDGRKSSIVDNHDVVTVLDLKDADEALAFLSNHPRAADIAIEGNAILEDPVELRKLVRKIDTTIAPLLAAVYFLQFLDKTTLSYTAVMGIREDTGLNGQDYSNLSMLFYIGIFAIMLTTSLLPMLTS